MLLRIPNSALLSKYLKNNIHICNVLSRVLFTIIQMDIKNSRTQPCFASIIVFISQHKIELHC